jgi:erythrocyte band 7 integral membrane protein
MSLPQTNGDSVKRSSNGDSSPSVRGPNDPIIHVQPPRREDLQPSYAQVIKPDTEDASGTGWYGGMINTLGSAIGTLGAIPCCLCCPNPYKPVEQGNVGLVTKFGRFARAVDPGLVKINPLSESLVQVDVKIQIVEVPKQVCMTKGMSNIQASILYQALLTLCKQTT